MADYIDREAAFDAITDLVEKAPSRSAFDAIWRSARTLNRVPAADVVLVVRCKDCKHAQGEWNGIVGCRAFGYTPMRPDDFCSYGEKRTEVQTMSELKPCPFCGGIEIMTFSRSGHKGAFAWVECDTCGAKTRCVSTNIHADEPDFRNSIAEEHLISLWNRRVGG